jgi:hypothetical protein
MGCGVGTRRAHHPVVSVSYRLHTIYLSHLYLTTTNRTTILIHLNIGEALSFSDLQTLATFFQDGPGRDIAFLHTVRFLSISYLDDYTATNSWRQITSYTYKAFELLYISWHLIQISWLQLCLPRFNVVSSVNNPEIWSLLKIRRLAHLTILGLYYYIIFQVRGWLKARIRKKKLFL